MKRYFFLLVSILFFCFTTTYSQQTYVKYFGGDDSGEWQSDLKAMKKNGYLLTGYTDNFGAGSYDAYCIRLDKEGKTLWSKTYGTSLSEYGTKCWGTSDAGFILLFNSHTAGNDIDDKMFVVKCDERGNIQWSKCIKPFKKVNITSSFIYQSSNGEYYILCDWHERGYYYDNFILMKLDAAGNLTWEKSVNAQSSLRYFSGSQISETDEGDILVSGVDEGDNYDSYGSYTALFLFSKTTGAIKLSKKICADYCGRGTYLYPYNFFIENNKLTATVDYNGICWFTAKLDNTQVQASYITYSNFRTCQYLLSKGFIRYPKGSWSSNLLFAKDGSIYYADRYFIKEKVKGGVIENYDIRVSKYDSSGRICPGFTPMIIDTAIHQTTIYISDKSYSFINDSVVITDTSLTVTNVNAQKIACNGMAPAADETAYYLNTITNKSILNLYPNPATNFINIRFETSNASNMQFNIINAEGKSVLTKQVFAGKGQQHINLVIQSLPAGMYYVKIFGLEKPIAIKFLKTVF